MVLTFHHAIADGMAGIAVVEDLMRALAGEIIEPLGTPDAINERTFQAGGFLSQDGFDKVAMAIPDEATLLDIAERPLWRRFKDDKVSVGTATLEIAFAERLREIARSNGTTVNSAICTALAIAAGMREARRDYTILNPVNLRPVLGLSAKECAMRAIAGTLTLSDASLLNFWALSRKFGAQLNELRKPERVQQTNRALERLIGPRCDPRIASGLLGTLGYNAVVSNLGRLSVPDRIGDVELEAIWGPVGQARLNEERFIGVATSTSVMRFIEATPSYQAPLLDALIETLLKVCED